MLDLDRPLTCAYRIVGGIRLQDVGEAWAAYSPASGQTHLLNDESAALLEWLRELDAPGSTSDAVRAFADAADPDPESLAQRIAWAWVPLEQAGLIRRVPA